MKKPLLLITLIAANTCWAGCDVNIKVGSDGTVYTKGNEFFRHGLSQTNNSIQQTTRVKGAGISTHTATIGGIQQSSSGNYDNHLNLNILPEDSYYEPCQLQPEKFKKH